jgi:hypothetical protein
MSLVQGDNNPEERQNQKGNGGLYGQGDRDGIPLSRASEVAKRRRSVSGSVVFEKLSNTREEFERPQNVLALRL